MNGSARSAVIVTVPSAEDAVAQHRTRFDRAAGLGVPAHVTILYPFVPPSLIDAHVISTLAAAVATVPRFHAACETTGWFGTEVLWLDPQPADRFRALTTAVARAFPAHPPYGGEYDEVIPHLTVGHDAELEQLRDAAKEVLPHLPIRMTVKTAALWCGTDDPGSWQQTAELPLG
jgi:2'-5' RNA ligase